MGAVVLVCFGLCSVHVHCTGTGSIQAMPKATPCLGCLHRGQTVCRCHIGASVRAVAARVAFHVFHGTTGHSCVRPRGSLPTQLLHTFRISCPFARTSSSGGTI